MYGNAELMGVRGKREIEARIVHKHKGVGTIFA